MDLIQSYGSDGVLTMYIVNRSTMVVPSFGLDGVDIGWIHVKDQTCVLKHCKSVRNVHALAKKTSNLCIHNLLVLKSGRILSRDEDLKVMHKADHIKTVDVLLNQLSKHFPSLKEEELKIFLPKNRAFITELRCEVKVNYQLIILYINRSSPDISEKLKEYLNSVCNWCHSCENLEEWPYNTKSAYVISLGYIGHVKIPLLICKSCGTLNYPDVTKYGLFPLHNKCLLSIDFIIELKDMLVSGSRQ